MWRFLFCRWRTSTSAWMATCYLSKRRLDRLCGADRIGAAGAAGGAGRRWRPRCRAFSKRFTRGYLDKGRRDTWREAANFSSGRCAWPSRALPWRAYGAPAPLALQVAVGRGKPRRLLENSRGTGRANSFVHFRRRATGQGACGIFLVAIGVPVYQGYGLTETSPVMAVNTPLSESAWARWAGRSHTWK